MADEFREEVIDLHRFLEQWLKGEVPRGDGQPRRLAEALAEDYAIIHPNGSRGGKAEAVRAFASSYGEKTADYALRITRIETRMLATDICLATYEEDHVGEAGRARISTAVLRRRPGSPIEWLFLQETSKQR